MNLLQRFMGRRQFLIATGVASTCALTCKKLASVETHAALAADRAAVASKKAANNKYPHLLSPLRIRNVVLKNRILHTASPPHYMQGPENFPTDAYRNHYSNMAKNAAIVTVEMCFGEYPKTYSQTDPTLPGPSHGGDHNWEDIPPVHNYINRLIEDIHCEGALVHYVGSAGGGGGIGDSGRGGGPPGGTAPGAAGPQTQTSGRGTTQGGAMPQGQATNQGAAPGGAGPGGPGGPGSQAQASVSIEDIITQAKEVENKGYDVVGMNGNNIEAIQAVRNATNLLIMVKLTVGGGMMMGGGPDARTGTRKWTYDGSQMEWNYGNNAPGVSNVNQPSASEIEQAVEAAKALEGLADIIWIRDGRHEHPNSFIQDRDKPFNLAYAKAIKESGVKIITCPSAGFHIAAQNEQFIASGQTDMVGMTTPFFADPEYIKKAYEGRAEDIVPCLMCHDCHGISRSAGPWYDSCNVNPKWAVPLYKIINIPEPTVSKKVAVIGGGPGGMKAAITAAERGHKVTLFEKSDSLGGLLQFTDYTQWKWTYKDFKDYLINQVKKKGIDVKLKTTATPEIIKAKGYDTVLVATGAEPIISKLPGADASNVFNILTAYSNKKALGKNVVIIGAGRIGTECGIGLAKDGHKVMVLASGKDLIEQEFIGPHNMMNQINILEGHPNFDCVMEVTAKSISGGKVNYTDSKGSEKSTQADSVVIYSGLRPRMDEAMKFQGSADQVLLLGDCTGKNGTIQKTIRSAFFVASQV